MGSGNTWENRHSELFEHGDPVWEVRRLALIRAWLLTASSSSCRMLIRRSRTQYGLVSLIFSIERLPPSTLSSPLFLFFLSSLYLFSTVSDWAEKAVVCFTDLARKWGKSLGSSMQTCFCVCVACSTDSHHMEELHLHRVLFPWRTVSCELYPLYTRPLSSDQLMNTHTQTLTLWHNPHTQRTLLFFSPQHLILGFVWDSILFISVFVWACMRTCASQYVFPPAWHMNLITYQPPPKQSFISSKETQSFIVCLVGWMCCNTLTHAHTHLYFYWYRHYI